MQTISLAIALHFHQPTGNFDHIFERAYNSCYAPFLKLLSNYPQIKMMFHVSGCLLDYLEERHPDSVRLIASLVRRRQIEIMGGAYYEPILTAIAKPDVAGQINMMSDYIKKTFKTGFRGVWIAERVWDPQLADLLYDSGARYLVLDDEHIIRSGIKEEDIHGYFLTGSPKKKIAVFPSNKRLRYLIPFRPIQELTDYLRQSAAGRKDIMFTYGDDAEKFGEWPGTHAYVYTDKWLDNFFTMLTQNRHWIKLVHFSEYLSNHKPQADLKIGEGSYSEMMEWSQGRWLNFLSKYPESNQMHNKMLYVSSKLAKARRRVAAKIKDIESSLYKGQCNCAYWHGVFGGLYLYHLRKSVYSHLIEADKLIDNITHKYKKGWVEVKKLDFDLDGKEEAVIENKDFSIYVDPQEGGIIKELDYRPSSFNLVNTLTRRKEPYHEKILKSVVTQTGDLKVATIHDDFRKVDPSFKSMLIYDKFDRCFLRSFFLKDVLTLDDLISSSYKEAGSFSKIDYSLKVAQRGIILTGEATIEKSRVELRKDIRIASGNELSFSFNTRREPGSKDRLLLGLEFNITMPELNSDRYFYCAEGKKGQGLNAKGHVDGVSSFGISDIRNELGISFSFSERPVRLLYFPVETISQSERAYDLNYQCSCIFGLWDIGTKKSGASHSFNVKLTFRRD